MNKFHGNTLSYFYVLLAVRSTMTLECFEENSRHKNGLSELRLNLISLRLRLRRHRRLRSIYCLLLIDKNDQTLHTYSVVSIIHARTYHSYCTRYGLKKQLNQSRSFHRGECMIVNQSSSKYYLSHRGCWKSLEN